MVRLPGQIMQGEFLLRDATPSVVAAAPHCQAESNPLDNSDEIGAPAAATGAPPPSETGNIANNAASSKPKVPNHIPLGELLGWSDVGRAGKVVRLAVVLGFAGGMVALGHYENHNSPPAHAVSTTHR